MISLPAPMTGTPNPGIEPRGIELVRLAAGVEIKAPEEIYEPLLPRHVPECTAGPVHAGGAPQKQLATPGIELPAMNERGANHWVNLMAVIWMNIFSL